MFGCELENPLEGQPGTGWLATGDLGFIIRDDVYITGRIKDMIIVDGRNIYPQDLEHCIIFEANGRQELRPGKP